MSKFCTTPPQVHLAYGMLSFLLGFSFIVGGPARASSHAYSFISQQGGPYVWGTVLVVLGVALIMSVDRLTLMRGLLLAGTGVYLVLAWAFLASAVAYPEANFTAVVAYGGYAAFHLCAYARSRPTVTERKDARRVAALRALLRSHAEDKVRLRAGDSTDDTYRIVLERAGRILSDSWPG